MHHVNGPQEAPQVLWPSLVTTFAFFCTVHIIFRSSVPLLYANIKEWGLGGGLVTCSQCLLRIHLGLLLAVQSSVTPLRTTQQQPICSCMPWLRRFP